MKDNLRRMKPEEVISEHQNAGIVYDHTLQQTDDSEYKATMFIVSKMVEDNVLELLIALMQTLPFVSDEGLIERAEVACGKIANVMKASSRLVGPMSTIMVTRCMSEDEEFKDRDFYSFTPEEVGYWVERKYKQAMAKMMKEGK